MDNIRIVMVETTHPGNIGAAARAMKNMGLQSLSLVAPARFPCDQASVRASGADDLLSAASVHADLASAVADCRIVIGASARRRSVSWPLLTPGEAAPLALRSAQTAPVALVFGRESSGLSNAELDRCTHLLHIPTAPEFGSLNVAMAIQLVAYELRLAWLDAAEGAAQAPVEPPAADPPVASNAEMEGLFAHLEQALDDIGFIDARRSDKLMRRLRRLFHRAAPDADEVNILRGILSAAQGRKSMRQPGE